MAAANYTYLCVCVAIRDHLEPPDQARARDHRGGVQRRRRRLAWAPTAPTRHPLRCVGEQQEEHEEEHEDDKDDEDEDEDEKDDEEDEEDEDKDEDKDEDEDEDDDDEGDEEHPRPKPRSFRWWWWVEVGAGALCLTFGGGPQQLVVGQHEGPALVLRNQLAHKLLRPCRRRCGHRHPKAVKPGAKGGHQSLAGWQQRRKERRWKGHDKAMRSCTPSRLLLSRTCGRFEPAASAGLASAGLYLVGEQVEDLGRPLVLLLLPLPLPLPLPVLVHHGHQLGRLGDELGLGRRRQLLLDRTQLRARAGPPKVTTATRRGAVRLGGDTAARGSSRQHSRGGGPGVVSPRLLRPGTRPGSTPSAVAAPRSSGGAGTAAGR